MKPLHYLSVLALFLLFSCKSTFTGQTKTWNDSTVEKTIKTKKSSTNDIIQRAAEAAKQEAAIVTQIEEKKLAKYDDRKIDASMNQQMEIRLQKFKRLIDSVNTVVAEVKTAFGKNKRYRTTFKKYGLSILFLSAYADASKDRLERLEIFNAGLGLETRQEFELSAFFGPGGYAVPEDKKPLLKQKFEPLVDSLVAFSNKYSKYPRTGTVIVLGYADGVPPNPQSVLGKTLLDSLNKPSATGDELNGELSRWRARELASYFLQRFQERRSDFINREGLVLLTAEQGRGVEFPNPKIKDYTPDDPRRRIVVFYWSLIPDL
jgi:hypothetical protein